MLSVLRVLLFATMFTGFLQHVKSKIMVTPSGIPADVCIWVQSAEEGWRSNFEESFPLCLLPQHTHTLPAVTVAKERKIELCSGTEVKV